MFSKQEAQQLKKDFWIAFGKSFPRKWLLYDTKIKDFSFKILRGKRCPKVFGTSVHLQDGPDVSIITTWEKYLNGI